jgi:Core-2/I-Branching enzyme
MYRSLPDETGTGTATGTISYVILCHSGAPQVLRLARTIRALSPRARVLIRHDQPPGFIDQAEANASGADLLVSRMHCRWGHWSLVEASLEAFVRARELHDPEWIVLISGQDYPIRPLEPWETTLLAGRFDAVIDGEPLVEGPSRLTPDGNRERLKLRYTHRWYWLPRLNLLPRVPALIRQSVRRLWFKCLYPLQALLVLNQLPRSEGWVLGVRRRTVPWSKEQPVFKGSQWMALSRSAYARLLDGPTDPFLRDYFATTVAPDEAYFHTVLAMTPSLRINHEPISWLTWDSDVTPHPRVIDETSLDSAVSARTPFARKFDESATPGILDVVDRTVLFEPAERHDA